MVDLDRAMASAKAYQVAYSEYVNFISTHEWGKADEARARAVHAFDGHLDQLAAAGKRLEHFAETGS